VQAFNHTLTETFTGRKIDITEENLQSVNVSVTTVIFFDSAFNHRVVRTCSQSPSSRAMWF